MTVILSTVLVMGKIGTITDIRSSGFTEIVTSSGNVIRSRDYEIVILPDRVQ